MAGTVTPRADARFELRLPAELLDRIDRARGQASRSEFVRSALERVLRIAPDGFLALEEGSAAPHGAAVDPGVRPSELAAPGQPVDESSSGEAAPEARRKGASEASDGRVGTEGPAPRGMADERTPAPSPASRTRSKLPPPRDARAKRLR